MIFADSGFVIAWINEGDALHQKALDLLKIHRSAEWLTTDGVLLEVGNSLARDFRQEAVDLIENFLISESITVVNLTPDLFNGGFELYSRRHDKSWGLVDCVSFVVMNDFGVRDALAHDRHFRQAGFKPLLHNE